MIRSLLVCFAALAVLAVPAAFSAEGDMSLDEVIASHIEARGGRDALDGVKTMQMEGKFTMGGGMEAPIVMLAKRPNKVRLQFTVQGMTGVQAYDGETGWFIMPFGGKTDPEEMSDDQLKDIKDQADIDGKLVDWKDKGHQVELMGQEDMDGTAVYKLKVTSKDGDVEYHFLDAEYFLTLKVETKREVQGVETEIEALMGDFKEIDGLVFPHTIEQRAKGAPAGQNIIIDSILINPELSDDEFAMPAPAAPAAPAEGEGEGSDD